MRSYRYLCDDAVATFVGANTAGFVLVTSQKCLYTSITPPSSGPSDLMVREISLSKAKPNMRTNISADGVPAEYESRLQELCLSPAWTQLKNLTPAGRPLRQAQPLIWPYRHVRVQLLRAGDLVPMELAERRVLSLINPGIGRIATTPSIFLGMQLILPGERAPAHRHTPGAARLVVEGCDAFTIVDGQRLPMRVGDLLLTPPHHWHEHVHQGADPMIWMDILDHPVAIPLETSYLVGERGGDTESLSNVSSRPDASEALYRSAGLVPYRPPHVLPARYPMMRFPWERARDALTSMADVLGRDEQVHLMYVNPQSGASSLETICFSVRLLRPGEEIVVPRRSVSSIFHVLEGEGDSEIDGTSMRWELHDTMAAPTFSKIVHRNRSAKKPAFLFQADDSPLQFKLGFYEDEAYPQFQPNSAGR